LITGYAHYNQVIREVSKSYGTLLVGDEDSIPPDAKHYTDSVHFTDAGSVAMADRVAQVLLASPAVQALVAKTSSAAGRGAQSPS
jgi:lysophospholipase L1-like esterase